MPLSLARSDASTVATEPRGLRHGIELVGLLSKRDADTIRMVMRSDGIVCTAMTLARFGELVASRPRDAVVIDLEYCRATDLEALARLTIGIPALAYVTLSVGGMQRLAQFASQHGNVDPLIRGHDDLPKHLHMRLARLSRLPVRSMVTAALEPVLSRLPAHLSFLIREMYVGRLNVGSVDDLARLAYMSRRRLERLFRAGAVAPPQIFLIGARLIRHHEALTSPSVTSATMCRMLGIADVRTLDRQCRAALGTRLNDVRVGMRIESLIALLIEHACRPARYLDTMPEADPATCSARVRG